MSSWNKFFNPVYCSNLNFMGKWLNQDWQNPGMVSSVQYGTIATWRSPTVGTDPGSASNHRLGAQRTDRPGHRPCSFHYAPDLLRIQRVSMYCFLRVRTRRSYWSCMAQDQTGPLGTGSQTMEGWKRSRWDWYMQHYLWGCLHMWCSIRLKNKIFYFWIHWLRQLETLHQHPFDIHVHYWNVNKMARDPVRSRWPIITNVGQKNVFRITKQKLCKLTMISLKFTIFDVYSPVRFVICSVLYGIWLSKRQSGAS